MAALGIIASRSLLLADVQSIVHSTLFDDAE